MDDQRIDIPDFMKAYYDGSDEEGQAILDNLAASYQQKKQIYLMTTHAYQQAAHYSLYGSKGKELDPEIGLAPIREDFRNRAETIAKQYGYSEEQMNPEQAEDEEDSDMQINQRQNNNQQEPETDSQQPDVISDRQEFLNRLAATRSKPSDDPKADTTETPPDVSTKHGQLTERELFAANLKSIRERRHKNIPIP